MTSVTAEASNSGSWTLEGALAELRTPVGLVLMSTAAIGLLMAAHWLALAPIMVVFYFASVLMPTLVRHSGTWFAIAAVWAVAVVVQRNAMEDHVYLYLAWLVAVAVSLLDRDSFIAESGRNGRYLIATVFGAATIWKLTSPSFLSGSAMWTFGLLDDRLHPLMNLAGISSASLAEARPQVAAAGSAEGVVFDIGLSGYSTAALLAVSLGTIAIEALVAITHAVPDTNRLAKLRAPVLVTFGIVTYAIVPVLPFAVLLALIGSVIARGDRRTVVALAFMVAVTTVRFLTL